MKKGFFIIFLAMFFWINLPSLKASCEDLKQFLDENQFIQISEMETTEGIPYIMIEIKDLFISPFYIKIKEDYNNTDTKYTYDNIENNYLTIDYYDTQRITKYKIEIYGNIKACQDELLKTIEFDTLLYNQFYQSDICKVNRGYEKCSPFADTKNLTLADLEKEINEYNEKNYIDDSNNNSKNYIYLYIALPVLLIGGFFIIRIIMLKRSNKK